MKTPLNTRKWTAFFAKNRLHRPEPQWDSPIHLCPDARRLLEQSLREFQLGDGGGPASLIAWNAILYRQSQPGLEQVINLWVTEEKEHSRLLGGLLKRYDVEPILKHWSFNLFCALRRWLGVSFELQILTLTELSSTVYYRMLRQFGTDPALREVCSLILRDESGHVAFQNDRLAAAGAPWSGLLRLAWRAQFWLCGMGAASVLWASHGRCLRTMGATTLGFYQEVAKQFGRFLYRLDVRQVRAMEAASASQFRGQRYHPRQSQP